MSDIDQQLDLRRIWSRHAEDDPVFGLRKTETIEDLMDYWERMVQIYYDSGSGLIEVRALAFTPEEATAITQAIYDGSSAMINALSAIAREDSIRYAREELDHVVERLKVTRTEVTRFRNRYQIVDPSTDIQAQAGLLGSLQTQLAEALIEQDIFSETLGSNDPRLIQIERRVRAIHNQIAEERRKLGFDGVGNRGSAGSEGTVFADLVGEYERLVVDREFAEQSYISALAAYDAAKAEARRQSRYLAAYVEPTLAQKSQFPQREVLMGVISMFLLLLWAIVVLVGYSIKDRR